MNQGDYKCPICKESINIGTENKRLALSNRELLAENTKLKEEIRALQHAVDNKVLVVGKSKLLEQIEELKIQLRHEQRQVKAKTKLLNKTLEENKKLTGLIEEAKEMAYILKKANLSCYNPDKFLKDSE